MAATITSCNSRFPTNISSRSTPSSSYVTLHHLMGSHDPRLSGSGASSDSHPSPEKAPPHEAHVSPSTSRTDAHDASAPATPDPAPSPLRPVTSASSPTAPDPNPSANPPSHLPPINTFRPSSVGLTAVSDNVTTPTSPAPSYSTAAYSKSNRGLSIFRTQNSASGPSTSSPTCHSPRSTHAYQPPRWASINAPSTRDLPTISRALAPSSVKASSYQCFSQALTDALTAASLTRVCSPQNDVCPSALRAQPRFSEDLQEEGLEEDPAEARVPENGAPQMPAVSAEIANGDSGPCSPAAIKPSRLRSRADRKSSSLLNTTEGSITFMNGSEMYMTPSQMPVLSPPPFEEPEEAISPVQEMQAAPRPSCLISLFHFPVCGLTGSKHQVQSAVLQ